jgi:hypothetical protein
VKKTAARGQADSSDSFFTGNAQVDGHHRFAQNDADGAIPREFQGVMLVNLSAPSSNQLTIDSTGH